MTKTLVDFLLIVERITYRDDTTVEVKLDASERARPYIQISRNGWNGRKWFLSEHMTESEVVMTALKSCLTFEEHEAREAFKYEGVAVAGPHLNVVDLVRLIRGGELRNDVREEMK